MIGITHKRRLEQIANSLEAIHKEILDGYYEDDCLQDAVDCQVEINRIVWKLNQLRGGTDMDMWCDVWTPVTEGMPNEGDMVLVTLKPNQYGQVNTDYWKADNEDDWYYYKDEVIAWMPLPRPYEKGESHEDIH